MRRAAAAAALAAVHVACAATQPSFVNDDPKTGGECHNGDQDASRCDGAHGWWCCPNEYACGPESPDGTDGECDDASPQFDPNSGQFDFLSRGDAGPRDAGARPSKIFVKVVHR